MPHVMVDVSAHGHGKWRACQKCGATKHSGYFWLGGYRSKTEPPCPTNFKENDYIGWTNKAESSEGRM